MASAMKLYGFTPCFGLADPSPFVLKVDAYLRVTGHDYEKVSDFQNLQRAPKKKLPYLHLTESGRNIADSYFIIEHLEAQGEQALDSWLTDEQKATVHLYGKSFDEYCYWFLVHSRWIRDDTWPIIKSTFFSSMPKPLYWTLPAIIRRGVRKDLISHGLGRHSETEILSMARYYLKSLSTLLGNKTYFMGDQPCTLDVTAYGFLAQMVLTNIDNPLNQAAAQHDNLVKFCRQFHEKYYPNVSG